LNVDTLFGAECYLKVNISPTTEMFRYFLHVWYTCHLWVMFLFVYMLDYFTSFVVD